MVLVPGPKRCWPLLSPGASDTRGGQSPDMHPRSPVAFNPLESQSVSFSLNTGGLEPGHGRFNIGYGTAAHVLGHGDPFHFFTASEEIPPHLVSTDMVVRIPQIPWPSAALAGPGQYDALKFIDNAATRESVYQDWDDDVFEVP